MSKSPERPSKTQEDRSARPGGPMLGVRGEGKALSQVQYREPTAEKQTSKWTLRLSIQRLRQEDQTFKNNLSNLVRPCLKIDIKKGKNGGREGWREEGVAKGYIRFYSQ